MTFQEFRAPGSLTVAVFDPLHRGWMYAGTAAGVVGAFYFSTDFGVTWTAPSQSAVDLFRYVQSRDGSGAAGHACGGTPEALWKSTDGG